MHRISLLHGGAFAVSLGLFTACSSTETTPAGSGGSTSASTGASTSAGAGSSTSSGPLPCDPAAPLPPVPAADPCARVIAGAPGVRAVGVDLSAAHAAVRFFGPVNAYSDADQALIAALEAKEALQSPDLGPYAAALAGVACALPAVPGATLPPAAIEVDKEHAAAIIHPGTGPVTLPEGTSVVLVDLRDLQAVSDLRQALEAAVAPALAKPVARAQKWVRQHNGLSDEVFTSMSVYSNKVIKVSQAPIPATGAVDLPLALLVGPKLAPEAAELAATLRLAGRAWLIGEDVLAAVAEMRWQGVGATGVASRVEDLGGSSPWPDVIPADHRMADPVCFAAELAAAGAPKAAAKGPSDRPHIAKADPFQDTQPKDISLGSVRAALIAAHGAARTFFPYFATVGDVIDDRLGETLAALSAAPDRKEMLNALYRFGNALTDGHNFVFDPFGSYAGVMPVLIEDIAGEPVVRRSIATGIAAGDTITAIGGVPAADWYKIELARTSAASDGYRFNIASRRFQTLSGPIALDLRDPDGNTKTIQFQPQPFADADTLGFAPSARPAGSLMDLGAPELQYINLDSGVLTSMADFKAALTQAAGKKGLVLDMRGYPGINIYEVAARLIPKAFSSPIFRTPVLKGMDDRTIEEQAYMLAPVAPPVYGGPVVLLVGHATVSAAENLSTMLVDAQRVKVMGRRSAATNGDITGVQLPSGFRFTFTGTEVLHADAQKSVFHGVGIVPDAETTLTANALRDGVDPELEDAIAWLKQLP